VKQASLYFACDAEVGWDICGEESPPCSTWAEAREVARNIGWRLGRAGAALCPDHTKASE